jgi:hypothetical protein
MQKPPPGWALVIGAGVKRQGEAELVLVWVVAMLTA